MIIDIEGLPLGKPNQEIIVETVLKCLKKTSPHYKQLSKIKDKEEFSRYCRRYPGLMWVFIYGVDEMLSEWVSRGSPE